MKWNTSRIIRLRNNIRIDGISEDDNETWLTTEAKTKQVLKEKLNIEFAPEIERRHTGCYTEIKYLQCS